MTVWAYRTKRYCEVCNKPINVGKIHDRCKKIEDCDKAVLIRRQADNAIIDIKKNLSSNVKHWNIKDGKDKLLEMFPDIK